MTEHTRFRPTTIVLHHSATDSGDVEAFRREHLARGWSDVGYHYVIDNGPTWHDGQLQYGRPIDQPGAHAHGHNSYTIGVCLVGDFSDDDDTDAHPTRAQLDTLVSLLTALCVTFGITPSSATIVGHAALCNTTCPGHGLLTRIPSVIAGVRSRMAADGTAPRTPDSAVGPRP